MLIAGTRLVPPFKRTYVHSGGSLLAVTLLHGIQYGLVVLNRELAIAAATWSMMGVYIALAFALIIFGRRTLLAKPSVQL